MVVSMDKKVEDKFDRVHAENAKIIASIEELMRFLK